MLETVHVVNELDKVIGRENRQRVEEAGLIYRCSAVYVLFNGKLIVQKRSKNKKIRPSHYSIVEETVRFNESYEEAAMRGVQEELGLKAKNLCFLEKTFVNDKQFNDNFFLAVFSCNGLGKIRLDKKEIEEIKLLGKKEVGSLLKGKEKISPGMVQSYGLFENTWRQGNG